MVRLAWYGMLLNRAVQYKYKFEYASDYPCNFLSMFVIEILKPSLTARLGK